MKSMMNRTLWVVMCVLFASCGFRPNPEAVAKKAIREAEREIDAQMPEVEDPEAPFFLNTPYPRLIAKQSAALSKSFDRIHKEMGTNKEIGTEDRKAYDRFMDKKQVADSLTDVAREYIRAHYRQPIEQAIAEIEGREFPCFYNLDHIQTARAVVERNPNDSKGQAIRLRVEMTLGVTCYSHTVFFVREGVTPTPGYGNTGAAQFFRDNEGSRYRYDPGTPVHFFLSMQYGDVIEMQNLYIKACKIK